MASAYGVTVMLYVPLTGIAQANVEESWVEHNVDPLELRRVTVGVEPAVATARRRTVSDAGSWNVKTSGSSAVVSQVTDCANAIVVGHGSPSGVCARCVTVVRRVRRGADEVVFFGAADVSTGVDDDFDGSDGEDDPALGVAAGEVAEVGAAGVDDEVPPLGVEDGDGSATATTASLRTIVKANDPVRTTRRTRDKPIDVPPFDTRCRSASPGHVGFAYRTA